MYKKTNDLKDPRFDPTKWSRTGGLTSGTFFDPNNTTSQYVTPKPRPGYRAPQVLVPNPYYNRPTSNFSGQKKPAGKESDNTNISPRDVRRRNQRDILKKKIGNVIYG